MQTITPGSGSGEGAQTAVITGLLANTTYVASVYVKVAAGLSSATLYITLRELDVSSALIGDTNSAAVVVNAGDDWIRLSVSRAFGASGVRARVYVRTNVTQARTFLVDAAQLEAGSSATTYLDGDGDYSGGYAWIGTRHASISTRAGWVRGGGAIVDLDTLGYGVEEVSGAGLPTINHLAIPYGAVPGQSFQRNTIGARNFKLKLWVKGATLPALHAARAAFINAIKVDAVYPQQPLTLQYSGGAKLLEIKCHALSYGNDPFAALTSGGDLILVADNPFWRVPGNSTVNISPLLTLADATGIVMRSSTGIWSAMAGGINVGAGAAFCGCIGPDGKIYIGGGFAAVYNGAGASSSLTVNNIAVYDPTTGQWAALNGGVNGTVRALAFDAAGTLYAAGSFSTANGATATSTKYFAKWNGSAWSAVLNYSSVGGGSTGVYAMHIGADGWIYLGGNFTNWDGIAAADYIVRYSVVGAAYGAMGTGTNGLVLALAVDRTNTYLYAGGQFTTAGGVASTAYIARWNLRTVAWESLGGTAVNLDVEKIVVDNSNYVYATGYFTTPAAFIARYNGRDWVAMSTGLSGLVAGQLSGNTLAVDALDGSIIVGGQFTTAGGVNVTDSLARWTGSVWQPLEIDLPTDPFVQAIISGLNGVLILAHGSVGSATIPGSTQTLQNGASSSAAAAAKPVIRLTGPGAIEQIYCFTTLLGIFFNGLTLQAGEVLTINLTGNRVQVTSTWRGNCIGYVASGSDLVNWHIPPGISTVWVKFATGTTTGATEASIAFVENYWSYDV